MEMLIAKDFDPGIWFYIIFGIPLILFILAIVLDKKNKPSRVEGSMIFLTSIILIKRFIDDIKDIKKSSKKLCKEMLCDIFYILNLFYSDKYGSFDNGSFLIKSSERKEKLKKEFSEIFKMIDDDDIESIKQPEIDITNNEMRINLIETNVIIDSFKDDKDWGNDLTMFWKLIYIHIGSLIKQ
tara:strand:+ start:1062 stop:1610 length:549 start_codon:yes stop_codon:yes gene_type:complete